jgi:hypothetical protein
MFEEPPKQKKVMSEERKQVLREQLRKAREKKLANKNARQGKKVEEKPVVEEIKLDIIKEEPEEHEEYEEPVAPRTKKLVKKRVKIVEPESDEEELVDATDLVENLKKEIAELKKGKTSSEDMDEIRSLKEELKDIRDAARAYKKQKSEKPVEKKPIVEIATHVQQAPRFSTYKKSIWSGLL